MAEQTKFPTNLANGTPPNGTNGLYYPGTEEGEGNDISLHEILEILFKNKWIILTCFVGVLVVAALYTWQKDPEYEADSTVYVNTKQTNPQLGEMLGINTSDRNLANEIEIIKSRRIAELVAKHLLDIERIPSSDRVLPILQKSNGSVREVQEVARALQKSIQVRPVSRGVDIIELKATSTVPKEAVLISTTYAREYKDYNRMQSRSRMTATRDFLQGVTGDYSERLQETESSLTAFLNKESVIAPDEEGRQLLEKVSELEMLRNQARMELAETNAELRALEAQADDIMPGLADDISSGDELVINQLRQQISQLEVAIQTKYARNPELKDDPSKDPSGQLEKDLRALASLQAELNQRTQNLVEGGGSTRNGIGTLSGIRERISAKRVQVDVLETRIDQLNAQVGRAQGRLNDIPRKDLILSQLERSRQLNEQLYVALEEELQNAMIAVQSEQGFVEIVDEAIIPENPVRPRVRLNLIMGAVMGLLLGLGLAFVRNMVDNKVRKPEDLRKRGHYAVGVIPDMGKAIRQDFNGQDKVVVDGQEYNTRLIALLNPLSPIAEGYRRVRTNIQFATPDKPVQTLMISSPSPSEGKTVTALNLAITVAQAGRRTLYIDADLRRPQGHKMMGIAREPGLVDLLFDVIPDRIEQFATGVDSYLYVMPAGQDVPNPAEVLGSRKMQTFLARWKKEFDLIIIDTPPTLVVADALIISSYCDAALVVAAAGETNWQAVDRSVEALEGVGGQVMGVLLNRFDAQTAYGGYKYGYGYGYEYGYSNYYYGQGGGSKSRRARLGKV
ncbi:MAG TPA: polysaccharide biosynthesis tyrosine autokinase [Rhodothermales bacterium]|nr:polysaccharide biosynthesis tyrosine autokinase [Rhodothermales bacterium]